MSRATPQARPAVAPRVKVWLEVGGKYAFGLGIAEMLQAIDAAGSIKGGAASLGKSYRHVWGRLKQAEQALGCPLVETQQGGHGERRSALSPEARRLVEHFHALRDRLAAETVQAFESIFGGSSRRTLP